MSICRMHALPQPRQRGLVADLVHANDGVGARLPASNRAPITFEVKYGGQQEY